MLVNEDSMVDGKNIRSGDQETDLGLAPTAGNNASVFWTSVSLTVEGILS